MLAAYLANLRTRLVQGDFADHPPIDSGDGRTLVHLELVVRVVLRDAKWLADIPPGAEREPSIAARRWLLADNLRRLRRILT